MSTNHCLFHSQRLRSHDGRHCEEDANPNGSPQAAIDFTGAVNEDGKPHGHGAYVNVGGKYEGMTFTGTFINGFAKVSERLRCDEATWSQLTQVVSSNGSGNEGQWVNDGYYGLGKVMTVMGTHQ